MALGEACGIAAHLAIRHRVQVRSIPATELQSLLVEKRGVITFYEDLPFTDPAFAAFQFLGSRGLNSGYRADQTKQLTRTEASDKLARILKYHGKSKRPPAIPDGPITMEQFAVTVYKSLHRS